MAIFDWLSFFYFPESAKLHVDLEYCPQQEPNADDSGVIMLHCLARYFQGEPWNPLASLAKSTPSSVDASGPRLALLNIVCSLKAGLNHDIQWDDLLDMPITKLSDAERKDPTWIPSEMVDHTDEIRFTPQSCTASCAFLSHFDPQFGNTDLESDSDSEYESDEFENEVFEDPNLGWLPGKTTTSRTTSDHITWDADEVLQAIHDGRPIPCLAEDEITRRQQAQISFAPCLAQRWGRERYTGSLLKKFFALYGQEAETICLDGKYCDLGTIALWNLTQFFQKAPKKDSTHSKRLWLRTCVTCRLFAFPSPAVNPRHSVLGQAPMNTSYAMPMQSSGVISLRSLALCNFTLLKRRSA
jgi:hypothetical protein